MRGKRKDTEFVSTFISDCVVCGKDTPESIVEHAKHLIANYDEQIKQVEALRIRRAKLLDVVATFESPTKTRNPEEVKALSFLKIRNTRLASFLCHKLTHTNSTLDDIINSISGTISNKTREDIIFAVKQLLEHKVISKVDNLLVRGELFEDYLKFAHGGAYVSTVHQS